ncbi:MAG: class I SAM-dependent methyltransferase [Proteobacteria bacterium]|nr:class I SAM-dependent methyltransferase [Pseudomonadota bacterium]
MAMAPRQCILCSRSQFTLADSRVADFEYGSPGVHDYWACDGCGLVAIDPQPGEDILAAAYPPDYHAYLPSRSNLGRYFKMRYWRRKARAYARLIDAGGRILDVGCANGDFLAEMRRQGFTNLLGLDFSEEAVRRVRARDLEAVRGEVDTADLPDGAFDLIVMTNFIEHVPDPGATMVRCRALLRPGGYVVGETPNIACWDYRFFRRHWGGYHAPRHFFLFDPFTLARLGERAGLRACSVRNMVQPAHWALSVQNRLHDSWLRLGVNGGRSIWYTPLQLATIPVNITQHLLSQTTSVEFIFQRSV